MKECICNKCEKSFIPEFKHEVIAEDEQGGEVVQTFFTCPHCETRYNSLITDSKYRQLLDEYRRRSKKIYKEVQKNQNQAKIQAMLKKLETFETQELKPYYQKMKEKYRGDMFDEQFTETSK